MKAVILAGGRGERLRPLTDEIPKPMLPVNGKPILEHQINLLKKYEIKDIIICGHHLFSKIKEYFKDGKNFGVNIKYFEEIMPLGTGGAIKNVEKSVDETFLVIYGDEIVEMNLKNLIDFHKKNNALATLVLHESDHPYDSGLVLIENNKVLKFLRKPEKNEPLPTKLSKTSIYVFNSSVFDFMPEGQHDFDNDFLPILIKTNKVYGYITNEFIKDIGTFDRYKKIKKKYERFLK